MKLPDKPSELIRLALSDLRKVEKMKTRKVDMWKWHEPVRKICHVCLAGAVMDRSLKVKGLTGPSDLDRDSDKKLCALDDFRQGICANGFLDLGLSDSDGCKFNREIPEYKGKGNKFHKAMNKLADDLESGGY